MNHVSFSVKNVENCSRPKRAGFVRVAAKLMYSMMETTPFGAALAGLLLVSATRAALTGTGRSHFAFQMGNAGLWAGVTGVQAAAVMFGSGAVWPGELMQMVFVPMGVLWLFSSLVGSAIVGLRKRIRARPLRNISWLGRRIAALKERGKNALHHWVDQVFERQFLPLWLLRSLALRDMRPLCRHVALISRVT